MNHLEDSVRAAVEELAATAPNAHDLASVARARGTRIRRRRRAVVGLVAAVLVGTVLTPYAIMEDRRGAPRPVPVAPTSAPTPSSAPKPSPGASVPYVAAAGKSWWTEPISLPGGLVVTAISGKWVTKEDGNDQPPDDTVQEGSVYLNRATGRYRVFPGGYRVFAAAPTGRYVMVDQTPNNEIGIADIRTGRVNMLGHGGSSVQWSPDGTKLLLTLNAGGFRIIDAATGERRDVPGDHSRCPEYCFYTWLPGGKQIALAQRDLSVPRSESLPDTVKSVQIFSVSTGKLLRELPITGSPGGTDAWSPDGRHVLLLPSAAADEVRVAEVATGRTVATIPVGAGVPVRFVGNDTVMVAAGRDLHYFDLAGTPKLKLALPADLTGRELSFGPA